MCVLFVSVLFKFTYTLVYVHLLAILEGYDEGSRELVEYLLAQAVYLVVVVGSAVGVLLHTSLLVTIASFKPLEVLVAWLKTSLRYQYLHLKHGASIVYLASRCLGRLLLGGCLFWIVVSTACFSV